MAKEPSGFQKRKMAAARAARGEVSKMDRTKGQLTSQQMKAVDFYEKHNFSGQKAAMEHAGYANPTWTLYDFFRNPKVVAEIERRRARYRQRHELTEDWIIQRLMMVADTNMGDIMLKLQEHDYNLAILSEQERYQLGEFQEEVYFEGREDSANGRREVKKIKVKPAGKLEALSALCRKLGLFNDKLAIDGEVNIVERLQAARAKFKGEDA